jgi:hypothetical protein
MYETLQLSLVSLPLLWATALTCSHTVCLCLCVSVCVPEFCVFVRNGHFHEKGAQRMDRGHFFFLSEPAANALQGSQVDPIHHALNSVERCVFQKIMGSHDTLSKGYLG